MSVRGAPAGRGSSSGAPVSLPGRPALPARKRRTYGWAPLAALAIGVGAVLYRTVLVLLNIPPSNSDEAVVGLVSLHISQGRAFPVYLYGQDYMGMLEAYLAAPLIKVFGPGVVVLRVPLLLLFAVFLVVMYHLARRLYSPGVAVATVAVLGAGSDRVLSAELTASGGYPEIAVLGALLFLIAVLLAQGRIRRPPLGLAAFGLAAGAAIWSDPLVAPYVATATLLLVATSWRLLRGFGAPALTAGVLVGAAPLIWHDLRAAPGHDSFSVLTAMSGAEGPLTDRLSGALMTGLPMAHNLCPADHCGSARLWWPPVYLTLLAVTGWIALRAGRAALRRRRTGQGGADRVSAVAALALGAAAAMTIVAYARSYAPVFDPVGNVRYLHCLLITTPALVATVARLVRIRAAVPRIAGVLGAALVAVVMLWSTVAVFGNTDRARELAVQRSNVVAELRERGDTRVYAEYWSCHWLTFLSAEEIMCGVLDDFLMPGWDRYPGWRAAVEASDRVAYLAPAGGSFDATLRTALEQAGVDCEVLELYGYHLYAPRLPGARLPGT